MIERFPAIGGSSAFRLRGKYEGSSDQMTSYVIFPGRVIGLSIGHSNFAEASDSSIVSGSLSANYLDRQNRAAPAVNIENRSEIVRSSI